MENFKEKIEIARKEWDEAVEGLKQVHTNEDLKILQKKIKKIKHRRLKIDADFRREMETRKREHKVQMEQWKHEMEMEKVRIQTKMQGMREQMENSMIGNRPIFPTPTPRRNDSIDKLICPICKGPNRGNIMNGIPTCMICKHKLIPISHLKKYNRKYRRNWKVTQKL